MSVAHLTRLPSKCHISYVQRKPRRLFNKLIYIFTFTTSWYFCQNTVKTALLKILCCACASATKQKAQFLVSIGSLGTEV